MPTVGGAITLTADRRAIDTKTSGFTISPHEECAVEEAVRLVERFGGSVTVVTLGPAEAEEQLRACLALGASARGAARDARPARRPGRSRRPPRCTRWRPPAAFDLVLLGNEASDTGDYQVGIRLAHLLGRPVATGIKAITVADDGSSLVGVADLPGRDGDLHAAAAVRGDRQGGHQPAALPVAARPAAGQAGGRSRGYRCRAAAGAGPMSDDGCACPTRRAKQATVLGHGVDAVPALVSVLAELGVLS